MFQSCASLKYGRGDLDRLRQLLENKADPNHIDPNQNMSLHYTCKPDKGLEDTFLSATKLLIEHGADVNGQGWCESTPLLIAATVAHTPMVSHLLEAKADIEARFIPQSESPLRSRTTLNFGSCILRRRMYTVRGI